MIRSRSGRVDLRWRSHDILARLEGMICCEPYIIRMSCALKSLVNSPLDRMSACMGGNDLLGKPPGVIRLAGAG